MAVRFSLQFQIIEASTNHQILPFAKVSVINFNLFNLHVTSLRKKTSINQSKYFGSFSLVSLKRGVTDVKCFTVLKIILFSSNCKLFQCQRLTCQFSWYFCIFNETKRWNFFFWISIKGKILRKLEKHFRKKFLNAFFRLINWILDFSNSIFPAVSDCCLCLSERA